MTCNRRGRNQCRRKTEISVNLKINTSLYIQKVIRYQNIKEKGRLSENDIEAWKTEESFWNILLDRFKLVLLQ